MRHWNSVCACWTCCKIAWTARWSARKHGRRRMLGDVVRDFGLTLGLPDMALDARGRPGPTLGNGEAALALALEHVPEGLLFGLGRLRTLFPPDAEEQALRLCAHMDMRPLLRPARSDNAS